MELGLVSNIAIDGNSVSFDVKVSNPAMHSKKRMEEACCFAIEERRRVHKCYPRRCSVVVVVVMIRFSTLPFLVGGDMDCNERTSE